MECRSAAIQSAIEKAASFLRKSLHSGAYGLACVGSDDAPRFAHNHGHVFVASFMAEAMDGLLDEIDRTIVLVRILSEEFEGAWGYQPPGPRFTDEFRALHVDADDTAYVIRTLRRLDVNRAPDCLMRFYREPERLFVTWDTPGPVSLATEASLHNNLLAHPEVNANVFLALRGTHLDEFINYELLQRSQDERGFWRSYFYPSPLFATQLVLDLLRDDPTVDAEAERGFSFITGSQNADGSWDRDPYETALGVLALAGHEKYATSTRKGVDYLLGTIGEDGSWTSAACVWLCHRAGSDVWRAYDTHRAYVSARCLAALRQAVGELAPFP